MEIMKNFYIATKKSFKNRFVIKLVQKLISSLVTDIKHMQGS